MPVLADVMLLMDVMTLVLNHHLRNPNGKIPQLGTLDPTLPERRARTGPRGGQFPFHSGVCDDQEAKGRVGGTENVARDAGRSPRR